MASKRKRRPSMYYCGYGMNIANNGNTTVYDKQGDMIGSAKDLEKALKFIDSVKGQGRR